MKIFFQIFLIAICCILSQKISSQVGINTYAPDTSAALHIVSKPSGSGLLIPRIFQAKRFQIFQPANSLMVYDLSSNIFYYNRAVGTHTWFALNPWMTRGDSITPNVMYTHNIVTNVGIGIQTPSVALQVNGSITSNSVVTTNTLTVPGFANNALVPTGVIVMWSGSVASIPAGWTLCNGSNGSPDLRGRFILSVGQSTNAAVGDLNPNYVEHQIGGENSHQLNKSELPKHKHVIDNGLDGSSISNPGNHEHNFNAMQMAEDNDNTGNASNDFGQDNKLTDGAGNHIHTGVTGDGTSDGLNDQRHENRPAYYVLAYIMKL